MTQNNNNSPFLDYSLMKGDPQARRWASGKIYIKKKHFTHDMEESKGSCNITNSNSEIEKHNESRSGQKLASE
jgi:hypothetical protein